MPRYFCAVQESVEPGAIPSGRVAILVCFDILQPVEEAKEKMMTKYIESDKIKEIIGKMEEVLASDNEGHPNPGFAQGTEFWKKALENALNLRTLADMSPEESAECQWMQADAEDVEIPTKMRNLADHLDRASDNWIELEKEYLAPQRKFFLLGGAHAYEVAAWLIRENL